MDESKLKLGSTFMLAMGIYLLVLSIFWIFVTEIAFVSDFLHYTGQTYADFLASDPATATLYMITKKLLGVILLLVGLLTCILTKKCYQKGEKWSWYALLITGCITWGAMNGYRFVIGYYAPSWITMIIGAVLFALGIIIPAKTILGEKKS